MFKYADTVIYNNEEWTFINQEGDKCVIYKNKVYSSITIKVDVKYLTI